jgi:hypothetical protein
MEANVARLPTSKISRWCFVSNRPYSLSCGQLSITSHS